MTVAQIEAALVQAAPEERFVLAARLIAEYQAVQDNEERRERMNRKRDRR